MTKNGFIIFLGVISFACSSVPPKRDLGSGHERLLGLKEEKYNRSNSIEKNNSSNPQNRFIFFFQTWRF
jgi:hypothetical protein